MDKKHIILSILFILPFLGLEMSPVGGSWITSSIIWIAFIILLVIYNRQFVKQIRIRQPFILASQHAGVKVEKTATDGSPLDFSVRIESIEYRYESIFLDHGLDTQKRPPRLVAEISFRTKRAIQIASLHLEIDPIDPRDIIEPDSSLAQGFPLPHILRRAETHQFQFQLLPENVEGEHKLHLKVLAGGRWYTDGPYTLNRQE